MFPRETNKRSFPTTNSELQITLPTGVGSGVCRGSNTPTIYVGDIDMYIPLEKSNT